MSVDCSQYKWGTPEAQECIYGTPWSNWWAEPSNVMMVICVAAVLATIIVVALIRKSVTK